MDEEFVNLSFSSFERPKDKSKTNQVSTIA